MTMGMLYHLLPIQILEAFTEMIKIQITKLDCNTRGTVTIALYRKWRVKARSRSMEIAARLKKDTPAVIQFDRDWSIFNVQNASKLSLNSAILCATNSGWHIRPTRRSETARQPKRTKDGEWRSWVFPIANTMRKFPPNVIRESRKLRIQVTIFAMKTSCDLSKITCLPSKKKQVFPVVFIARKVYGPFGEARCSSSYQSEHVSNLFRRLTLWKDRQTLATDAVDENRQKSLQRKRKTTSLHVFFPFEVGN